MATLDTNKVTGVSTAINATDAIYKEYVDAISGGSGIPSTTGNSGRFLSVYPGGNFWTLRTSGFGSTAISSLATNNSTYIASGNSGTLTLTTDGVGWFLRTSGFGTTNINSSTYFNNEFLIGGFATTISWVLRTSGASFSPYSVGYGNNLYLVTGPTALITSTDTINWTIRTTGYGATALNMVGYGTIYIASGNSGSIAVSTDGISWTKRTSGVANNFGNYADIGPGIIYGNGNYLVTGTNTVVSTDTIVWQVRTTAFGLNDTYGLIYGTTPSTTYGVFGRVTGALSTSTDTINWTARTTGASSGFYISGVYGNSVYILASSFIRTSTDCITWTARTLGPMGDTVYTVSYGDGIFIAGSSSGSTSVSTDGITWIARTSGFGTTSYSSTFGNGNFLIVAPTATVPVIATSSSTILKSLGNGSLLRASTDAVSWTTRTNNTLNSQTITLLASAGSYSFAHGTNYLGEYDFLNVSTDNITWQLRTSGFGKTELKSIRYGNSIYVAGGTSGLLLASTDSITWVARTSGFGTTLIDSLAYGTIFVAGGVAGTLTTSTDSVTWVIRTTGFGSSTIQTVFTLYDSSYFIAAGDGGYLSYSTNGIVWTQKVSAFGSSSILSSVSGTNFYVLGGSGGTLTSSPSFISNWQSINSSTTTYNTVTYKGYQEFTSPGAQIFYVPPTATQFYIEAIGAGGGGSTPISNTRSSGGGSGAYNSWLIRRLELGDSPTITVTPGTGGTGGLTATSGGNTTVSWTGRTPTGTTTYTLTSNGGTGANGATAGTGGAAAGLTLNPLYTTAGLSGASGATVPYPNVTLPGNNSTSQANAFQPTGGGAGAYNTSNGGGSPVYYYGNVYNTTGGSSSGSNGPAGILGSYTGSYGSGGTGGGALSTGFNSWYLRTSGFGTSAVNTLTYGNGYFVAGGFSATISWTLRTSGAPNTINPGGFNTGGYPITYDGSSLYLYCGSSGMLATSTNAVVWVLRTSGFGTTNIGSVAYGAGRYVACGSAQWITASTDAITWVLRTAGFTGAQYSSMLYVNNAFSILSSNTQPPIFINSTDSIVWTQSATFPTALTSYSAAFVYASGAPNPYVISPSTSPAQILVSTNTIVWVLRTSGTTQNIYTLSYNGVNFYVGGGTSGYLSTSTDTISWTLRTSGFGVSAIYTIVYNDGIFVAGGQGPTSTTSTDGITWTLRTTHVNSSIIYSIFYSNNTYIAAGTSAFFAVSTQNALSSLGNGGLITVSTDSITWTLRTNSNIQSITLSASSDSYYVASGSNYTSQPVLIASTDNITWITRTTGFGTSSISALGYGNNEFLSSVAISNPVIWTLRTSGFGTSDIYKIVYGGSFFVASGISGTLTASTDGVSWSLRTSGFGTSTILPATYFNGEYLIAGRNDVTWILRTTGFGTSSILNAIYGNNSFLVGGSSSIAGGSISASTNGINWAFRTSGFGSTGINFYSYFNNQYLIGGASTYFPWTAKTSGTTNTINSSIYFNSLYHIGGNNDFIVWTLRTSGFGTSTIATLTYGTVYVASGGPTIATSTDSIAWTIRTSGVTSTINSINYGNSNYLYGTNSVTGSLTASTISNSLLGAASLTSSTTPTSGTNDDGYWTISLPWNISYNGTSYNTVYVGTNSYITFDSGQTVFGVSASNPAVNKIMIQAADNSAQRVYFGTEGSAPNRTYRIRYEGNNATSGTLGSPTMVWEAVFYENSITQIDIQIGSLSRTGGVNGAYSSSTLLTTGNIGTANTGTRLISTVPSTIAVSTDAISWILRTTGTNSNINIINYLNTSYISGGSSGLISTSTDSIAWTLRTSGFGTSTIATLTYGTVYVASGGPTIATSTDSIAWTIRTSGFGTSTIATLTYGTVYVASGGPTIATSTDSIAWTIRTSGVTSTINTLVYDSNLYVASGSSGINITSTDAITWFLRTSGFGSSSISTSFDGNNIWIIGGVSGTLATSTQSTLNSFGLGAYFASSTDSVSWTLRTTTNNVQSIIDLTANNLYYLAPTTNYIGQTPLIASTDSIIWSFRTSGFGTSTINAVTYGTSFVAGGSSGTLMVSTDTISWTFRTSGITTPITNLDYSQNVYFCNGSILGNSWLLRNTSGFGSSSIYSVGYGNGVYLAAGANGILNTSTDSINWTVRTSGFGTNNIGSSLGANGVSYVGSTYVIVGGNGSLSTSTDAISWTAKSTGFGSTDIQGFAGTGSTYVIGGFFNLLRYSLNSGDTWTTVSFGVPTHSSYGMIYAGGQFVSVGVSASIITSASGTSWTFRTSVSTSVSLMGIAYSGSIYAVSCTDGSVITSTNAIQWTARTTGNAVALYSNVTYANGRFLTGYGSVVIHSTDGIVWQTANPSTNISIENVANDGTNFIIGGGSGNFAYSSTIGITSLNDFVTSTDTITWTLRTNNAGQKTNKVNYGTLYVSAHINGVLTASTDSIVWSLRTSGVSSSLNDISYDNNLYVVGASNGITLVSTDTIVWISRTSNVASNTSVFGNNTYLIAGNSGGLATSTKEVFTSSGSGAFLRSSTDTISWISRTAPLGTNTMGSSGGFSSAGSFTLGWGTNASSNNFLIASTDAVTWTLRTALFPANVYSFTFGNNIYLYTTQGSGGVATSTDTISWTLRTSGSTSSLFASTYGSLPTNTYIVAGSLGYLATSTDSITWTLRTTGFGTTNINSYGLTYNDGLYTATIPSQQRTSTDGISWFLRTSGFGASSIYCGAYGNNIYIISGDGGTLASSTQSDLVNLGNGGLIRASTDSISWISRTTPANISLINTMESGGSYVLANGTNIIGQRNSLLVSTDNIVWTLRTSGLGTSSIELFAYGANTYVIASSAQIWTSTDTISWVARTSSPPGTISGVLMFGERFVATDNVGFRASTDAINWVLRTASNPGRYGGSGVYNNGLYVLTSTTVPFGDTIISTDTITWIARTTGYITGVTTPPALNPYLYTSVYGNNIYVIGGSPGIIATSTQVSLSSYGPGSFLSASTDTISWTIRTTAGNDLNINAIGSGGSYSFISILNTIGEYKIVASTNNIIWQTREAGFGSSSINSFVYGTVYVAAGQGGALRTSTDSIVWTLRTSGFGTSTINSLAYTTAGYVAAGVSGSVRTSTDAISWIVRTGGFGTTNINNVTYGSGFYVLSGSSGTVSSASSITQSVAGAGGAGTRGGGGGGGGYSMETNAAGIGGTGGNGYVKITWW